jgi:hypothetical protein
MPPVEQRRTQIFGNVHDWENKQLATCTNLNTLRYDDETTDGKQIKNNSFKNPITTSIRPVFRDIEKELVEAIENCDSVVGCMAWLTNEPILKALAKKKAVQIVVQQEDWLRPDSGEWTMRKQRELYKNLKHGVSNWFAACNYASCDSISPIRVSGAPKNKNRNQPRMHHKFLVFIQGNVGYEEYFVDAVQHSVWTGSFNATKNGTNSLENGVFIYDNAVAQAYTDEWRTVLMASAEIENQSWYGSGYITERDSLRDGT